MLRTAIVRHPATTFLLLVAVGAALAGAEANLRYPRPKTVAQVDDYFGTKIADPYRGLEDPNNPDTKTWVNAENRVTSAWLSTIPQRDKIRRRLTELSNFERYPSAVTRNYFDGFSRGFAGALGAANKTFFFRKAGLQNQAVLFQVENDGIKTILDPNNLRKDGTAALCGLSFSHHGQLLEYGVSQAGSDWCEWRTRRISTGEDTPDLIQWTKDTMPQWTPDDTGFYYSRFPKPSADKLLTAQNLDMQIFFHKLGDPQSADRLIYRDPEHPTYAHGVILTAGGRYLLIPEDILDPARNQYRYLDLKSPHASVQPLIVESRGIYGHVGIDGDRLLMRTTDGAPKARIIAIDLRHPERDHWKTVIPEQKDTITYATFASGKFLVSYMHNAQSRASLYSAEGKFLSDVALEGAGTAVWSTAEQDSKELFYSFETFTSPTSLWRLDLESGRTTVLRRSKTNFDASQIETEQVFYPSADGIKIPMFLVHRRDLPRNGKNPTILYGYGGFDIAITPSFFPNTIEWIEQGGLFAVANLRGGSEYGEDWHLAGTKAHKQTVFNDFVAAAEWLIAKDYTSRAKLAIQGESNGGLLVGACLTQRPDLFGAALASVGVMDMLRYQKFTSGSGWVGEFGSSDNAAEFKTILAYSPLHNIRKGVHYPATLILTSDHDDRVVPAHSYKFAATLQAAQGGTAPILLRVETSAGHGGGKPTSKVIEETTDQLAFLSRVLNSGSGLADH